MKYLKFKQLIASIKIGKHLLGAVYLHESAVQELPPKLLQFIEATLENSDIEEKVWNVLKLSKRDFKISFLSYPDFENNSYPELHSSYFVDLERNTIKHFNYTISKNPPILHRKETLVLESHPLREHFSQLTQEGEAIGLYENTRRIGFKQEWLKLIASKGYFLDEKGHLKTKDNESCTVTSSQIKRDNTITNDNLFTGEVERHRTAINRHKLSSPMKTLAKHGYLDRSYSLLDYGCGKGDDLRELELHGLDCEGWDPAYRPEGKLSSKDIVNLGFVLNVIEDREERDDTLKTAWGYAQNLLIVSVMVAGRSTTERFTPYKDGVITSINTFQKYYSQTEIANYIEVVLNETPIAVGQGVFIVFKDKTEEQRFLLERQFIKRNWQQKSKPITYTKGLSRSHYEKHKVLFDDFWQTTLDLGRMPTNSEFEYSEQLRRVAGSHKKALDLLKGLHSPELFKEAETVRYNDLLIYFALGLFRKRRAYAHMPESLKRDIKAFFGTYTDAITLAKEKLFSIGNPSIIEGKSLEAYAKVKSGSLSEGHSWTFHHSLLKELPVELRIYVGCAAQLFGDIDEFDLIKVHFTSGKVTLLKYDDWNKDAPLLTERVKIHLRDQDIDFFYYGGKYDSQPLGNKEIFS